MEKCYTISQIKALVHAWKSEGLSIGLVPTMGYLHEGHASLIERAVRENDRVIVSDFVNPMQFGANEDLSAYPRDFDRDCAICEEKGASAIFHPTPEEMYGEGFVATLHLDEVTSGLCGADRPTHFDGVCTVVSKLFHISEADRAYFGKKDAQQLAVVRRMVRNMNENIEIIACDTVREADGLAKSSRNVNLTSEERKIAPIIKKALDAGLEELEKGKINSTHIENTIREILASEPLISIDYVKAVEWDSLKEVDSLDGATLVAVAVRLGKVRLIDNFIYGE